MNPHTVEVVDSLSLLALKRAPNVFDLSSGLQHVSIRDQIVRAQLLVRDLYKGDSTFDKLLVVGAGVAGFAAAMAAADLGKKVVVLDVKDAPFSLFRDVHKRFVGPFMYEWPSPIHTSQSYPPRSASQWGPWLKSSPKWLSPDPVPAHALFVALTKWGKKKAGERKVAFFMNANGGAIKDFVREFSRTEGQRGRARLQGAAPLARATLVIDAKWEPWTKKCKAHSGARFSPTHVLLAGGMGGEDTNLCRYTPPSSAPYDAVKGIAFWADDTLCDPATAALRVGIFGGGDGGIQDGLRALTNFDHPLQLIAFLEKNKTVARLLATEKDKLWAIEQQSRLIVNWTAGASAYHQVDAACRAVAVALARRQSVAKRVELAIRHGVGAVTHCVREEHFGKAYILNRFLAHLLDACQPKGANWPGRMRYDLRFQCEALNGSDTPGSNPRYLIELKEKGRALPATPFDVVAVRYGIERNSIPGAQMIQLSDRASRQRTTLSHISLPFVLNRLK